MFYDKAVEVQLGLASSRLASERAGAMEVALVLGVRAWGTGLKPQKLPWP